MLSYASLRCVKKAFLSKMQSHSFFTPCKTLKYDSNYTYWHNTVHKIIIQTNVIVDKLNPSMVKTAWSPNHYVNWMYHKCVSKKVCIWWRSGWKGVKQIRDFFSDF